MVDGVTRYLDRLRRLWPGQSPRAGFTLIELLVSVTILMALLGGGLAAYLNFNDKQKMIQAGRDVLFLTRAAQKKARVGDKPATCTKLNAYELQVPAAGGTLVNLNAVCSNGTTLAQSLTLPAGVTVSPAMAVRFAVLHGGASANQTVIVGNGTNTFTFTIGTGGDISEGVVQ